MPMATPRFTTHGWLRQAWTALGAWALLGIGGRIVTAAAPHPGLHQRALRGWCRAVSWFLRIEFEIEGRHHVDTGRSYVVAPLHEGFGDVLALARLGLDLRFVALQELADWPILGTYLERSDHVLIRPDAPRAAYRKLLRGGRDAVAAGQSFVVFPQGTILGLETDFQEGAFALARRLDVPVLPVVITGTHRIWEYPFGSRVRYRQRVSVEVLEPIDPRHVDRRDLQARMKLLAQSPHVAPARRFDPGRDGWWSSYPYRIDPEFSYLAAREARERYASEGTAHDDVRSDIG